MLPAGCKPVGDTVECPGRFDSEPGLSAWDERLPDRGWLILAGAGRSFHVRSGIGGNHSSVAARTLATGGKLFLIVGTKQAGVIRNQRRHGSRLDAGAHQDRFLMDETSNMRTPSASASTDAISALTI